MRPLYKELAPFYEALEERDYEAELTLIDTELKRYGCKTVIDLGCGTGLHVRELAKRGYEAWGVDISSHMIRTAKRLARGVAKAKFIVADYYSYRAPKKFDCALCLNWSIPVNTRDLGRFFKNTARLLKPGGVLLIDYEKPDDIVWEDVGKPVIDYWEFKGGKIVRVSVGQIRENVMRSRDVYVVFGSSRMFMPPSERERYLGRWARENVTAFLDVSYVRFYDPVEIEGEASRHGFRVDKVLTLPRKRGYKRLYSSLVRI
ncbi:MAG: class I SAM-dependent methyltransferase [Nitrososphaerota archaeon]